VVNFLKCVVTEVVLGFEFPKNRQNGLL